MIGFLASYMADGPSDEKIMDRFQQVFSGKKTDNLRLPLVGKSLIHFSWVDW